MHAEPAARPGGPGRPRRIGRAARIGAVAAVVGLGAVLGVRAATGGAPAPAATPGGGGPVAGAGRAAPGGVFTLLDHRRVSLASLRGRPVLVWFVAAGCSSCEASIPVVASHLAAFGRAGTRVLVLGMYGVYGQGPGGTAALASFGKAAAGKAFASPGWTWGVASERCVGGGHEEHAHRVHRSFNFLGQAAGTID